MITPCPECKQDLNSASPSCRHPKRHVSQTTPPDSGETCRHECQCGYRVIGRDEELHTYDAVHTWSKCVAAETPTAWRKPYSGEYEVMPLQPVFGKALDGAWHIAVRTYPTSMDTACGRMKLPASEFFSCADTKARIWCVTCVNARPAKAVSLPEQVSLPLSLAQRILAALEEQAAFLFDGNDGLRAHPLNVLVAELRERLPR